MTNLANIYRYIDYLQIVEIMQKSNAKIYGYKSQMAEAAGCQRSFFSQVLKGQVHLTPEQALGLATFWNIAEAEREYFVNLVLFARSGTKALKNYYLRKIEAARAEHEKLSKRIGDVPQVPEAQAALFFSSWHFMAINILITIPNFRTSSAIASRLSISTDLVDKTLTTLHELGFVRKEGSEWRTTNATIHQPRDSIFSSLNHSHWRKRASDDAFLGSESSLHYTSVCSLSKKDVDAIKQLVLQLIDESRKIVAPSVEEELYCLVCDWFRV